MTSIPNVPGRVHLLSGPGGLETLALNNAHGSLHLTLHGAHVTHWQPTGHLPVLWMSAMAVCAPLKPIRGGIPICWPWFGPHDDKKLPIHGFVRLLPWTLAGVDALPDGRTRATLTLSDSEATRAWWPRAFALKYTVTLGPSLDLELTTTNSADTPLHLTEALHTYFAVADVLRSTVRNLSGRQMFDKAAGGTRGPAPATQSFSGTGDVDRVFFGHHADAVIDDPVAARRIRIAKAGSSSTVVWNPGPAKAKTMPDFGDAEWTQMLCVETANALDDGVIIAPGASRSLSAKISIDPLSMVVWPSHLSAAGLPQRPAWGTWALAVLVLLCTALEQTLLWLPAPVQGAVADAAAGGRLNSDALLFRPDQLWQAGLWHSGWLHLGLALLAWLPLAAAWEQRWGALGLLITVLWLLPVLGLPWLLLGQVAPDIGLSLLCVGLWSGLVNSLERPQLHTISAWWWWRTITIRHHSIALVWLVVPWIAAEFARQMLERPASQSLAAWYGPAAISLVAVVLLGQAAAIVLDVLGMGTDTRRTKN